MNERKKVSIEDVINSINKLNNIPDKQQWKTTTSKLFKVNLLQLLSNRDKTPEYVVQRLKKDKRAATRNAKLRLSNIKLGELTQILRGKSKRIKH